MADDHLFNNMLYNTKHVLNSVLPRSRAVASDEEAEGHLAGCGANNCLPSRRGGLGLATPGNYFVYLIQNPAF